MTEELFYCPDCGGDGHETCHNPDHGFIHSMPGETGRLGCPVCGHHPNGKIMNWENGKRVPRPCYTCAGTGKVTRKIGENYLYDNGCDFDLEPLSPPPTQISG